MRYREFIETYFDVDDAKTGALIPFIFNKVQARYYDELLRDYDLEKRGVEACVRDIILKARREGFSSLVLALFAADDILQLNPTESQAVSYRDDATKAFYKRYRLYVTSYYRKKDNITDARQIFEKDNGHELVLKRNGARFFCGTASARVAGRGGVLQKLLFSEAAHYPDTEIMTAREIIDGTLRQVDIHSGLVFLETTANGYGNYYEQTWAAATAGTSRFKPRFYGWRDFYTEDEFVLISSEFTDKQMLKQEYPETPEEAFIASGSSYFDNEVILAYIKDAPPPIVTGTLTLDPDTNLPVFTPSSPHTNTKFLTDDLAPLAIWKHPIPGHAYTIGGDVAEGIEGGDYSTLAVIDNATLETVAKVRAHMRPDIFANLAYTLGLYYNTAYLGIEANKDGLWVNTTLFEELAYPNLYYREAIDDITRRVSRKAGWLTSEGTRRYLTEGLQRLIHQYPGIWTNKDLLEECLVFVRNRQGRPEAMLGKNDDEIIATAIAYEIRRNAPLSSSPPNPSTLDVPQTALEYAKMRLQARYKKSRSRVSQRDYI